MPTKKIEIDETTGAMPTQTMPTTPAPEPIKRQVEQWARDRGYLPQFMEADQLQLPAGVRTDGFHSVEVSLVNLRAPRANPEFWRFAAAKALCRWPEGKEVTETEFDEAIHAATDGNVIR